MKRNPFVKLIIFALLGIIVLTLLNSFVFNSGYGVGFNMRGNYGGERMYMNTGIGFGYGYGGTLSYFLSLFTKLLFAIFVIALIAGFIVWVKNNFFTAEDVAAIKSSFLGNEKAACTICGKDLNYEWKVCPHCGKEKE